MRSIQNKLAQRHRWNLFLSSIFTWFVLWLTSPAVFRRAEHGQNWSYFKALYFTYTFLMTIGYGDIYLKNNFGKSFFVFWFLLAVPTLTILISSMGATVLKLIKEVAVWASDYALIIGESSLGGSLKHIRISPNPKNDILSNDDNAVQDPASLDEKTKGKKTDDGEDNAQSNYPGRVGDEQIGGQLGQNTQYYHYLLVEEIANVVHDLSASHERQYTYEEWTWFIALISAGDESGGFYGVGLAAPNSHVHSASWK
jgi:potassium channel subfamily K, other eukaryote